MKTTLVLVLLVLSGVFASAQQPRQPVLRVTIDPPVTVVGQGTTLKLDVLAPNFMTKPPVLPEFQIHNAITRQASTINMSEQIGGEPFAGVRYEFLIYPQEPGTYATSGQSVTVTYAADPPNAREETMPVPAITFEATIPEAARALDPFIAASRLTLRQELRQSSDQLKVGDSVTRTITVTADGTPAMLLPPAKFAAQDGVQIYPMQPDLHDMVDRRTNALSATRVDQATYMLQRAGTVTLPGAEIAWWNTADKKIDRMRIEPVTLNVAANSLVQDAPPPERDGVSSVRAAVLFLLDHSAAVLLVIAVISVLIWIEPSTVRTVRDELARRRAAYLRSEAFAYSAFRDATHLGNAQNVYRTLLAWVSCFEPAGPQRTLASLKAAAGDPSLDEELASIEGRLFAAEDPRTSPSFSVLGKRIDAVRRRLSIKNDRSSVSHSLPRMVNPESA